MYEMDSIGPKECWSLSFHRLSFWFYNPMDPSHYDRILDFIFFSFIDLDHCNQ